MTEPVHLLRGKTAAVLGAGPEQLYAIGLAQELGVSVVAFDRNPQAPGFGRADRSFAHDPSDVRWVLSRCHELNVAFLLPTPMGALLEVAGRINDELGLPGIGERAARLCADKWMMREALAEAGLPQPRVQEVRDIGKIGATGDALGWPVIIKPREGSGSRGVVVLTNADAAVEHLSWHRRHAVRRAGESTTLVEEWIEGPEFGIDAAMVDGLFHLICVRRKEVTALPFRLAYGVSTPPRLEVSEIARLSTAAEQASRAIGLDNCLIHLDMILQEGTGSAYVIELGGRPSGFRISSHFVPAVTGLEPVREMILHYGRQPASFVTRHDRAGVMRMLRPPEGRMAAVRGLDEARRVSGVVGLECALAPGDVVLRADSGPGILGNGYVMTVADTLPDAVAACDAAVECLQFEVEAPLLTS